MIYRIWAKWAEIQEPRNPTKPTNSLGSLFFCNDVTMWPTRGKVLIPKKSSLFVYNHLNNMGSHAFATMYAESVRKKNIMAKITLIDLSLSGLSGLIHVLLQTLGFLVHQCHFS